MSVFFTHALTHTCRYDLFYLDDDEQDPFEQLKQKKQKSAAAAVTAVSATTTGKKAPTAGQVINTNIGQAKSTNVNNNNSSKTAEKENKISASNKSNQNNEKTGTGGKGGNNAQRSKGIKETGNVKALDNRGPRDGKSNISHSSDTQTFLALE